MTAPRETRPARSPAEWVTFSISVAILAVVVGLISVEAMGTEAPPAPEVRRNGGVTERNGGFVVPVLVLNRGDTTVAAAEVIATLTDGDGDVTEEGSQVIDFLAGGEGVELEFRFGRDPRRGELDIRVASYQLP